jgi:hypothetical protein
MDVVPPLPFLILSHAQLPRTPPPKWARPTCRARGCIPSALPLPSITPIPPPSVSDSLPRSTPTPSTHPQAGAMGKAHIESAWMDLEALEEQAADYKREKVQLSPLPAPDPRAPGWLVNGKQRTTSAKR